MHLKLLLQALLLKLGMRLESLHVSKSILKEHSYFLPLSISTRYSFDFNFDKLVVDMIVQLDSFFDGNSSKVKTGKIEKTIMQHNKIEGAISNFFCVFFI